jgi:hypothetical protein
MTFRAMASIALLFLLAFSATWLLLRRRRSVPSVSLNQSLLTDGPNSPGFVIKPQTAQLANSVSPTQAKTAVQSLNSNTLSIPSNQLSLAAPKPLIIPGIQQTMPAELEGCWAGTLHNPEECSPKPCNLSFGFFGGFIPEDYEICFRRETGDVLNVELAKGSFCGEGALKITGVQPGTIFLHRLDVSGPSCGCRMVRDYSCKFDESRHRLIVAERARTFRPTWGCPGSSTLWTWREVFRRVEK